MSAPRPPARKRRPEDLVLVGKVGRPYGLTGAFHVIGRAEPVPAAYRELLLGDGPETAQPVRIESSRGQGDGVVLKCSAANDRDGAQAITGKLLYVERERMNAAVRVLVWADLEGAALIDRDGAPLGVVDHVYNVGASDVAEVRGDDGKRLDVPLVREYMDLDQKVERDANGARTVRLIVERAFFDDLWTGGKSPQHIRPAEDVDE